MGLYTEVRGSGPDLVLLHGWSLNLRVWDSLVAELAASFRVITVDLPGHGRSEWLPAAASPAAQAWQVRAALEPHSTRYSLLGWSLGGQLALDLAAATPAQIDRLVLTAATPRFVSGPDWPYGMPMAALERMAQGLHGNYAQTVGDFLELQVRGSTQWAGVLRQLRAAIHAHGRARPEALAAGLELLKHGDLRPLLPRVQAPTLVIGGQFDRITPPWGCRLLAGALPRARFIELRRAAHAPFLSHLAEFAQCTREFLTDAEPV